MLKQSINKNSGGLLHIISIAFLFSTIFLSATVARAQTDTLVDSIRYNYVSKYENGKIHELGNYLKKGKGKTIKEGKWKIYNPDGCLKEAGGYKNGKKEGAWWVGTSYISYYKRGKVKNGLSIKWKHELGCQ